MSGSDTNTDLFEAVSHPLRIKILRLLQEKNRRFSEFKNSLQIKSSGNVTHHLVKLQGLISQDSTGEYYLTKLGRDALLVIEFGAEKNRKLVVQVSIYLSTIIFYALFLTFGILPEKYALILIGLACTLGYFLVFSMIARKKVQKANYRFIFGRNSSNEDGDTTIRE